MGRDRKKERGAEVYRQPLVAMSQKVKLLLHRTNDSKRAAGGGGSKVRAGIDGGST